MKWLQWSIHCKNEESMETNGIWKGKKLDFDSVTQFGMKRDGNKRIFYFIFSLAL